MMDVFYKRRRNIVSCKGFMQTFLTELDYYMYNHSFSKSINDHHKLSLAIIPDELLIVVKVCLKRATFFEWADNKNGAPVSHRFSEQCLLDFD